MGVLSDILRTARMECRVLSRHELVRNAKLAARNTDRGYFYATTGRSQLTSPGMAPAMQEARSLAIWLSPQKHALTILDEESEVVTGEICFAGGLADPLIDGLPTLVQESTGSDATLGLLFEQLLGEATCSKPGWERMCDHLADLLVVQALRGGIINGDGKRGGRLRGLTDPDIGPALQIMHEQPSSPWTVSSLAERLALSRSKFAARFKTVVGDTPFGYLTRLRLHRAAAKLRDELDLTLPDIARSVGYQTEAAFGKSFKRQFGTSPGAYRRSSNGLPRRHVSVLQKELKKRDTFEFLEQEVAINLVRTADRLVQEGDALMRKYGFSGAEYNILRILRGSDETLSADEIESRMIVCHVNAKAVLAELEKAGLIESVKRRLFRIAKRGRERVAAIDAPLLDLHRQQFAHMNSLEKEELNRLLVKARQHPAK
jgi:AraC-like DNA-binding protein/DNA-binding MarR family transcriptional regulator